MKRYIVWGGITLLGYLLLSQLTILRYGIQQAQGQFRVLWEAEPLEKVLNNPSLPDSVKARFHYIQEVKKFAEDSLGLRPTSTYQSFFDQKGKPLIWVITACPPYSLRPYTWQVPFLGQFSYKGFFQPGEADRWRRHLEMSGYETRTAEVSAWSTLGYLPDPILSSMLWRDDVSLAALLIHELTHSTLFVPNQLSFNENLADFIGDHGAKWFIETKFGRNSAVYQAYEHSLREQDKFRTHIQRGAKALDSLYASFPEKTRTAEQDRRKEEKIQEIVRSLDTLGITPPKRLPNNAFFAAYLTYQGQQSELEKEFQTKFKGNFKAYLEYLTEKYAR